MFPFYQQTRSLATISVHHWCPQDRLHRDYVIRKLTSINLVLPGSRDTLKNGRIVLLELQPPIGLCFSPNIVTLPIEYIAQPTSFDEVKLSTYGSSSTQLNKPVLVQMKSNATAVNGLVYVSNRIGFETFQVCVLTVLTSS